MIQYFSLASSFVFPIFCVSTFSYASARTQQEEVKEMIWEVDEDLDEHVSWDEFSTMYQRSVSDKTGNHDIHMQTP